MEDYPSEETPGAQAVEERRGAVHSVGSFACYRDDPATFTWPATTCLAAYFGSPGRATRKYLRMSPPSRPAKGAAARAAGKFAVVCRGGLFPDDLIKGAAGGTLEGW